MALLTREQLLTKQKCKIEQFDLGDGNFIFIREMSGRSRDSFEQSMMTYYTDGKGELKPKQNLANFRAKLAVATICDADGNLLLSPSDFEAFSDAVNASTLEKIIEVAQRLSAITKEDKDEMLKNSEADQPGNSTSDSV